MKSKPKNKLKKSFFSIRTKITLLCICSIILAVFVTCFYMVNISKKAITNSTEVTMQQLADSYSSNLSDAITKTSQSANFIMSSASISTFVDSEGKENSDQVAEFASMFLNSNTSCEDISIVNKYGIVLYSSNTDLIGTDLSSETYFTNMVSSGLSTEGNVFKSDTSGEACVTFAIPLRTDLQIGFGVNPQTMGGDPEGQTPVTEFTGAIITSVKVSEFSSILSDIRVGSYDSGYAYILDSEGNVIYDPKEELIGTKLDITEINDLLTQIQAGTTSEKNIITYRDNGVDKYAGYSIDSGSNWIVFTVADQKEVLASLNIASTTTIIITIALVALVSLLAFVITGTITRSIKGITQVINKTAELDFTEDTKFLKLSKKQDETGEMSRAIEKMRDIMKQMVQQISDVSSQFSASSDSLKSISYSVNEHAADNSATAEELSAGMQETAATTEQIYGTIEQIGNRSKDITEKVALGTKLSADIIARATELSATTSKTSQKTESIYEEVKLKTEAAIEQAKAVEKIQYLTNTIKDIANQTNLLSLNASIEAARAGEAGLGFAVVASEISSLANQSAATVTNITETVNEVYAAVNNLSKNLEQTLQFISSNVLPDYQIFISNSEKYNTDAGTMSETMESIQKQIDLLSANVLGITDSISEINLMVGEASTGVNDVAEKNTDIVALTSKTQDMVSMNHDYAKSLKEIVEKFKL
jgi:methyl-accepting chemotaxis protein